MFIKLNSNAKESISTCFVSNLTGPIRLVTLTLGRDEFHVKKHGHRHEQFRKFRR